MLLLFILLVLFLLRTMSVSAVQLDNDPLTLISVASLEHPSSANNTFFKQTLPTPQNLLSDSDNPYASPDHDLDLSDDGQGGFTAYVYTPKGFLEAIYDPASPTWSFNSSNKNAWKTFSAAGNLSSYLYLGGSRQDPLPVSNIHKIVLMNSIDITQADDITARNYSINRPRMGETHGTGVNGYLSYKFVSIRHDNLTITGLSSDSIHRYWLNMGFNNLALTGINYRNPNPLDSPYKENWTIEDLDIYGTTFWGIVSSNTGDASNYENPDLKNSGLHGGYSWITYKDISYTGSQLAWTGNGTSGVTIQGDVTVHSTDSYKSPGSNYIWECEGGGNQQNFQVDRIVFGSQCHYTGYTYDGQCLFLTGKATFESDSHVDLYPHGSTPELPLDGYGSNCSGMSWGIYMYTQNRDTPATIDMKGSAVLNIHCKGKDDPNAEHQSSIDQPCGAINMDASDAKLNYYQVKGEAYPQINIDSDGPIIDNRPLVFFASGTANLSHGSFTITAYNLGKYNNTTRNNQHGGLMYVGAGMNINVKTGGNFQLAVGDKNNDADSPINLLYSAGAMNILINNPENVSLDLNKHQSANSALVYVNNGNTITIPANYPVSQMGGVSFPVAQTVATSSGADIKVYNTRIKASGDTGRINDTGTINGETIGFQTPEDVNVGMNSDGAIRVQRLTLPFTHNLLAPLLYLNGGKIIQAPKKDLDFLRTAMMKMLGKEFRYIQFSDLPSPSLELSRNSSVIYPNQGQYILNAQAGGDTWENNNNVESQKFVPTPPRVHLRIHHEDGSVTELGTVDNSAYEAKQKTNSDLSGPSSQLVSSVTPNQLEDNQGNFNPVISNGTGGFQDSPTVGKKVDASPKYLDDSLVTWDNGRWDPSKVDNHTLKFDLQAVLKKYYENNPQAPKIHFKATDQIWTSLVANYQEDMYSITYICNLSLHVREDRQYLLGDDIQVPIQYYDGDDNFNSKTPELSITNGQIDGKALKGDISPITMKLKSLEKKDFKIGTAQEVGQHEFTFKAHDNATPSNYAYDENNNNIASGGDNYHWHYTVLNFPRYKGIKTINNAPVQEAQHKIKDGDYQVQTTFEPQFKRPLHQIFITQGDGDLNITKNTGAKIRAYYLDQNNKKVPAPITKDFISGQHYIAKDFGWSTGDFPAGTVFEVTQPITIKNAAVSPVAIDSDTLTTVSNDGTVQDLGTSNTLNYNTDGSVVLIVPTQIDYGNNVINTINNADKLPIKKLDGTLSIINGTSSEQSVQLKASLFSLLGDDFLDKNLKYQDGSHNIPLSNFEYLAELNNNSMDNISDTWFDRSNGKQVQGPFLYIPNTLSHVTQKHSAKLIWTLTFGPN
ncbi:hypothetical protein [Bombilactobacillus bombi]|uniref:hypothetical protein n=1 Tax=Bombilactobacillus bombi TaxID=1303590 RepID=UPI0015E62A20|nr:hypothetical protein [Bombilactobacillus bombi]MBA1434503.1 hypothetical protein [Bombilactobacillus bombi]